MQITNVSARNFRTLTSFEMDFSEGYCALSGRNNCGKTSVFKIIEYFLKSNDHDPFSYKSGSSISFERDKTQWVEDGNPIDVSIILNLFAEADSEVFSFIGRFSDDVGEKSQIQLRIRAVYLQEGTVSHSCYVDGIPQDDKASTEIIKKLRSINSLIIHNSTNNKSAPYYYVDESFVEILEAHFSAEDRKAIGAAQKNIQNKIRRATKQHKASLDALLGKLQDKFQVELTSISGGQSSKFPLQIKLNDRVADVALQEWGAGTQNRTRVLMSILDAQQSKEAASVDSRSTPIFLVEEPESFLHPSAQAEFGQVLNSLADEFGIQIIATTHSPYMLNQTTPTSNFLLERKLFRRACRETVLVKSDGENWMVPFAENLGVISSEFHDWKKAFFAQSSKVVLVEGELDREYLEIFKSRYPGIYKIPDEVEIVPYEGKDALKNTALLRFMINKFKRVFVTFDLDAQKDVTPALERLGLKEGHDFAPIGMKRPGCECIEGLLPDVVKKAVHAINVDDVSAMMSADGNVRKAARQRLKRAYLEYLRHNQLNETDLVGFRVLFTKIGGAFS